MDTHMNTTMKLHCVTALATSPQVRGFNLVSPGARTAGSSAVAFYDYKCFAHSALTPNIAQRAYVDTASAPDSHHAEQHTAASNHTVSRCASGLTRAVHTIPHTWTTAYCKDGENQGHEHTLGQAVNPHCVSHRAGLEQPRAPRATRADQHHAKGKRSRRPRQELHWSPNKNIVILGSFPKPSPVNLYKRRHISVVILPPKPTAPVPSLNGLTNRSVTMAPTLAHANTRATSTAHPERDTQHEMPQSIRKTPIMA